MSYEMRSKYENLGWFNAGGLTLEPIVTSGEVISNQNGDQLALSVTGPEEVVRNFLGNFLIAFDVEQLDDNQAISLFEEVTPEENDDSFETPFVASGTEVDIEFKILNYDPPYQWNVYFDPINEKINGIELAHIYQCGNSNSVTATISQDGGSLRMGSGIFRRVVNDNNKNASISRTAPNDEALRFVFWVIGLDDENQYDLHISGATLTRIF